MLSMSDVSRFRNDSIVIWKFMISIDCWATGCVNATVICHYSQLKRWLNLM